MTTDSSNTAEQITQQYIAVVNDEEQYSIWQADRDLPVGWEPAGCQGTKDECLDWIEKTWTDMRPLSLRKWLSETEA
ncbi:MAG TPA: MbtH family protein [Nitrospira sp.]|nr:MbtH family protein [Nitrospira sp.]